MDPLLASVPAGLSVTATAERTGLRAAYRPADVDPGQPLPLAVGGVEPRVAVSVEIFLQLLLLHAHQNIALLNRLSLRSQPLDLAALFGGDRGAGERLEMAVLLDRDLEPATLGGRGPAKLTGRLFVAGADEYGDGQANSCEREL